MASLPAQTHPLRHAPFVWFWVGQSLSLLGHRIYAIALPFLVLALGGDPGAMGGVLAAYSVPQLLFLLVGGVLVDRFPQRPTLVLSDVLHALLLLFTLALFVTGSLQLAHLYVLSVCFGLLSAFFMPAAGSFMPRLVPRAMLVKANALRAFAAEVMGILGPPLGGILITAWGLGPTLAVDSLMFVLGVVCFLALRLPRLSASESKTPKPMGYWRDLREGFAYVAGSTWLWVTISLFALGNVFATGATVILLPLLALARFEGAATYGWLLSAMATGALASALVLNHVPLSRRGVSAYLAVAVAGASLVLLALAPTEGIALFAMAIFGASLTVFSVVWETTLQDLIPEAVLGRVLSLDMLGSFSLLPVGHLLTGTLAEAYGSSNPMLVYGTATILLAGIGLCVPAVRQLE